MAQAISKQYIDEDEIRKAIAILKPDGQLFEIRILGNDKSTTSGYFTNVETMLTELRKLNLADKNVYITLGAVNSACYSRAQHDIFLSSYKRTLTTTSDKDIDAYQWFFIDFDPERPTGVSSNNEQMSYAYALSQKIESYLQELGFSDPLKALSGNGYHLLYKINLPNTAENVNLVKQCMETLKELFPDDHVKVDTTTTNPARVCKLYGTLAQKGSDTEDRPHRLSIIISENTPQLNDKSLLETLASKVDHTPAQPAYRSNSRPAGTNAAPFDIVDFMVRHGIGYKEMSIRGRDNSTIYALEECPFDSNHQNGDAKIFQYSDGKISFRCHHDSCAKYKWQDVRLLFEPDAYASKQPANAESVDRGWQVHKAVAGANQPVVIEEEPVIITTDTFSDDPHTWLSANYAEMGGPALKQYSLPNIGITDSERIKLACLELDGKTNKLICRWFRYAGKDSAIDTTELARAIIRIYEIHLNGRGRIVRTVGDHERAVDKHTLRRFAQEAIRSIRTIHTEKRIADTIKYTAELIEDILLTIPSKPTGKLEMIDADDLLHMEIPDLVWIVKDFLCEGLAALAAPEKSRKTFMALDLAVCVATGKTFMGMETNQGQVLYLNLEGTDTQSKKRLNAMNVQSVHKNLKIIFKAPTLDNFLLDYIEQQWLKTVDQPRLIVIDTIAKVEGAPEYGKDAYHAGVDMYGPIHDFAMKHHVCILAITHTRKGGTKGLDNHFDAITGSNALIATSATNLLIERDREDRNRAILRVQGRELQNPEDLAIYFDNTAVRWICEGTATDMAQKLDELNTGKEYISSPLVHIILTHCQNAGDPFVTTATELADEMYEAGAEVEAKEIGKLISKYQKILMRTEGISVERKRTKKDRVIVFSKKADGSLPQQKKEE